ncbi:mitochondrial outer membrane porin-like [Dendrobium catenatum]|uniref:mitochondrial outer membrane porin-like n=1 Tax=Dendrobium catenatum TaxID=906689 RepID=UPI0010A093C1|nr:mitochondrial outer membrane porin-like [Dendrobium catenatum]
MGPGLYSDIGKMARELLTWPYSLTQKFTVTTHTANGVAIIASGTKKNNFLSGEIQSQLKNKNVTVDVIANSESNVLTTFTIDNLGIPKLKTILSCVLPEKRPCKVEVQHLHEIASFTTSIELTANPIINFSGVIGTNKIAVGAHLLLDTTIGELTKYNLALSITNAELIASLHLYNQGDFLSASYYQLVSPLTNTAVGAELTHNFPNNENTLTFGAQHSLDPLTTIKAQVNNFGKASALIQHQWRPKSLITLTAEVDTKAIENSSKVGLSLLLNP